jgi:hypothetical protein
MQHRLILNDNLLAPYSSVRLEEFEPTHQELITNLPCVTSQENKYVIYTVEEA